MLHGLDQPFLKVEKVDLGYLSGGNLVRDNVNGIFGNDNVFVGGFEQFDHSTGVFVNRRFDQNLFFAWVQSQNRSVA